MAPQKKITVPAGHLVETAVEYGVVYPDDTIQWMGINSGVDLTNPEHQQRTQDQYDQMLANAKLPVGIHRVGFTSRSVTQILGFASPVTSLIDEEETAGEDGDTTTSD